MALASDAEWARYSQQLKSRQYQAAAQTLAPLVQQHDAKATLALAQLYRSGLGVPKDQAKARDLMQMAAEQGLAEAQYQLGLLQLKGVGGEQNLIAARDWLDKAAAQKHKKAADERAKLQTMLDQTPAAMAATSARNSKEEVETSRTKLHPKTPRQKSSALPPPSALQQRVDAARQSSQSDYALQRAVQRGDLALTSALLREALQADASRVWQADAEGHTLVTLASQQAPSGILPLLLKNGGNQAMTGPGGHNALFFAMKGGHAENLRQLLEAGCDPLQPDDSGDTPLFWAIDTRHQQTEILLQSVPTARWQAAWLPLAAMRGNAVTTHKMLAAGIDINTQDTQGRTALWQATQQHQVAIVDTLLQAHAPIVTADRAGNAALHIASQKGYADLVAKLLNAAGEGASADKLVNALNKEGSSPLHLASAAGHVGTVKSLLDFKAAINQRDHNGNTPLMLAVERGHIDTVSLLIENGAALDKRNNNKQNALAIAEQLGHKAIADQLRKALASSGVMSIFN